MTWIILSCKCLTMASRKYLFHDHLRYRGEAHQMVVPKSFLPFLTKWERRLPFSSQQGLPYLKSGGFQMNGLVTKSVSSLITLGFMSSGPIDLCTFSFMRKALICFILTARGFCSPNPCLEV